MPVPVAKSAVGTGRSTTRRAFGSRGRVRVGWCAMGMLDPSRRGVMCRGPRRPCSRIFPAQIGAPYRQRLDRMCGQARPAACATTRFVSVNRVRSGSAEDHGQPVNDPPRTSHPADPGRRPAGAPAHEDGSEPPGRLATTYPRNAHRPGRRAMPYFPERWNRVTRKPHFSSDVKGKFAHTVACMFTDATDMPPTTPARLPAGNRAVKCVVVPRLGRRQAAGACRCAGTVDLWGRPRRASSRTRSTRP